MEDRYRKIFWGFIITIFNINLGAINILPDFVGYLMIGSGLGNILDEFENKNIKTAKGAANFLVLYSVITYIIFVMLLNGEYPYKSIVETGISVLGSSISLVMAFYIISGTIDLYIHIGLGTIAESLAKTQRNYTALHILGLFVISISINMSNEAFPIASMVCLLIAQIYFAIIISGMRETFKEGLI